MSEIPAGCSPLATYYKEAKNYSKKRQHKIDTITIHCYVGQVTAKQGCDYFARTTRNASSNYVVGRNGSIGVSVPEKSRSYCTTSRENDNRAVTIEVASDRKHPYAVTDEAYDALIKLVADICKRNNIPKLVWSTDKETRKNHRDGCNMTVHRDFSAKACPGAYLYNRHGKIAAAVNEILASGSGTVIEPAPSTGDTDQPTPEVTSIKNGLDLIIEQTTSTGATVKLTVDTTSTNNNLSYYIYSINGVIVQSEKIKVSSKNKDIILSKLNPNTAYYIEVLNNLSDSASVKSPKVFFCTKPDKPSSISNLKIKLNQNSIFSTKKCDISFNQPHAWGESSSRANNRGYRVSLIINGKIKSYSDTLIRYKSGKYINTTISLNILLNKAKLIFNDMVQIGIQSWIRDVEDNLVFDSKYPVCSQSFYLNTIFSLVNQIYIKLKNEFKRTIIYNRLLKGS